MQKGGTMRVINSSDEKLWEVCRKLPSDWEPYGERRWPGRREDCPDCSTCRWFTGLSRAWPDWGACANPESARAGLLTFREQGCWQHEPEDEPRHEGACVARCDFRNALEEALREKACHFMREEVRKANDPSPEEDAGDPEPIGIRDSFLLALLRRLLRHAAEDFSRPAFDAMAARARKDTIRYWESARIYWARKVGEGISEIRLPENMRDLEDGFWKRVDAVINEALAGRGPGPARKGTRRAG
jgi:hypothetical protein